MKEWMVGETLIWSQLIATAWQLIVRNMLPVVRDWRRCKWVWSCATMLCLHRFVCLFVTFDFDFPIIHCIQVFYGTETLHSFPPFSMARCCIVLFYVVSAVVLIHYRRSCCCFSNKTFHSLTGYKFSQERYCLDFMSRPFGFNFNFKFDRKRVDGNFRVYKRRSDIWLNHSQLVLSILQQQSSVSCNITF